MTIKSTRITGLEKNVMELGRLTLCLGSGYPWVFLDLRGMPLPKYHVAPSPARTPHVWPVISINCCPFLPFFTCISLMVDSPDQRPNRNERITDTCPGCHLSSSSRKLLQIARTHLPALVRRLLSIMWFTTGNRGLFPAQGETERDRERQKLRAPSEWDTNERCLKFVVSLYLG